MTDLEPNVFLSEGLWRIGNDVTEALQESGGVISRFWLNTHIETCRVFLLLLVYYPEAEVNLVGFFKVWRHAHNLGECLLGMLERTIAVIEDANAIPQPWLLFGVRVFSAK